MINYFLEDDDLEMDVQVGPQEEIEVDVEDSPSEITPSAITPVDAAKSSPESITVAGVKSEDECGEPKMEFYVDCRDVIDYGSMHDKTIVESLNDIIEANIDSDVNADNLIVSLGESTEQLARQLELQGVMWRYFSESTEDDSISLDVQVGPNDDAYSVSEDPEAANPNPVELAKGSYDNVTVAAKDDKFFVDVEDVQKCADVKCESGIDVLNGIIAANEAYGITPDNLIVLVKENAKYPIIRDFKKAKSNVNCQVY